MTKRAPIAIAERTLPHNLDAERSVLGAILVNNAAFDKLPPKFSSACFFRDAHRRIFDAIADLVDRKVDADFVTLKEALARRGDLDEVGGPTYIAGLSDGVPRSTNVHYYAEIVFEKAVLRNLIYFANTVLVDAYEADESAEAILRKADVGLLDVAGFRGHGRLTSLASMTTELFAGLEHNVEHPGELRGVDTGFTAINAETFGWRRGDFIITAARPSMGKSNFALSTAVAAARTKVPVAFFSLEMKKGQLQNRLISNLSRVPANRLESGYISQLEWPDVANAIQHIHDLPIHIDDNASMTVHQIRAACRRMRAEHGLGMVIIDYIQLIAGSLDRRGATRNEEITDISRRLKQMAGELNVPVHALSQLRRKDTKWGPRRPQLEDLRESGSLEQDADIVAFHHRKNHKVSGLSEFILEKQRNGPTGTVPLMLDRETCRFYEASPEDIQAATVQPPDSEDEPSHPPRGVRRRKS